MGLLDFKEIPEANTGNGDQDTFEMFAREFFAEVLHFEIESEPNRGADGGKDLIVREHQIGELSCNDVRWLVSCKHKAHSGNSVSTKDEDNIYDRMRQHATNGFIGFYSTLPSSGLNNRLESLKNAGNRVEIFNRERIESILIKSKRNDLIQRFFPNSYKKALAIKHDPVILFGKYEPLLCEHCGIDLLKEHLTDSKAIITFIKNNITDEYVDVYACCKGHCDRALLQYKRQAGCLDEWEDITDWIIPFKYLEKNIAIFNQLYTNSSKYSKDAFEKLKQIILRLSQFALKEPDEEQQRRLIKLFELPDWI